MRYGTHYSRAMQYLSSNTLRLGKPEGEETEEVIL